MPKRIKSQSSEKKKGENLRKFTFPNDGITVIARDLADARKKRDKMISAPTVSKGCEDCR